MARKVHVREHDRDWPSREPKESKEPKEPKEKSPIEQLVDIELDGIRRGRRRRIDLD